MEVELWQLIALVLGPSGTAWVGVKVGLNGARRDITDVKSSVDRMQAFQLENRERLIRVEEKVGKPV